MMSLRWERRPGAAPRPGGLVAQGAAARAVLRRLAERTDTALQALTMVATRDMLVILGDEDMLPWLDGVRYCAPHAAVPGLWLPTHAIPQLPLDLAFARLAALGARMPFLLWDAPELVLPLGAAERLSPARLAWLEGELD